ncbi:MAG: glycosyltransferase, partial [Myxococcota bacterium]
MTSSPFRVAVVTPYYREEAAVLEQCVASVAAQTVPVTHFVVADGHPQPDLVDRFRVEHLVLPDAHGDNGNTPRAIGSLSAVNRGFDAIAYLDADNWYRPEHIERMVALQRRTGASVCTSGRTIHRLDGSFMLVDRESDGLRHVDTSCLFLTRDAFRLVP